jgi:hypothetical protein
MLPQHELEEAAASLGPWLSVIEVYKDRGVNDM